MDESAIKGFVYRKRLLFDKASGVVDFTELKCETGNVATLKLEKTAAKREESRKVDRENRCKIHENSQSLGKFPENSGKIEENLSKKKVDKSVDGKQNVTGLFKYKKILLRREDNDDVSPKNGDRMLSHDPERSNGDAADPVLTNEEKAAIERIYRQSFHSKLRNFEKKAVVEYGNFPQQETPNYEVKVTEESREPEVGHGHLFIRNTTSSAGAGARKLSSQRLSRFEQMTSRDSNLSRSHSLPQLQNIVEFEKEQGLNDSFVSTCDLSQNHDDVTSKQVPAAQGRSSWAAMFSRRIQNIRQMFENGSRSESVRNKLSRSFRKSSIGRKLTRQRNGQSDARKRVDRVVIGARDENSVDYELLDAESALFGENVTKASILLLFI